METAEVGAFLERILLICGLLSVSVFQKPAGLSPSAQLFYIKAKGLTAVGYEADDGFVVRAGSESSQKAARATPDSVVKLRATLLDKGVFVKDKDRYKLTQDYAFSSPSSAASAVLGMSANGRTEWKDEKGRTLKEVQEESIHDVQIEI
jgi:hypothetical protein